MGRIQKALLAAALCGGSLLGAPDGQAQSLPPEKPQLWEGLKKFKDVNIPFTDFIQDSVLMAVEPHFDAALTDLDSYDIVDINDIKAIKKIKAKIGWMATLQLETCRSQGLRRCPVSTVKAKSSSTAFVLNGVDVTTCRHGLHNWFVLALQNNKVEMQDLSPPMKLFNSKGKIVYDSSKTPRDKLLKIAFGNGDRRLHYLFNDAKRLPTQQLAYNVRVSDVMQYRSPVPIVKSHSPVLHGNFASVKSDTEVYAFGYPGIVKGYNPTKINDNDLAVSHGHVYRAMPQRGSYELTNFSYNGMSGGPVMTTSGEVLGLNCGAFGLKDAASKPTNVHAIMIVLDKTYLPSIWLNLKY